MSLHYLICKETHFKSNSFSSWQFYMYRLFLRKHMPAITIVELLMLAQLKNQSGDCIQQFIKICQKKVNVDVQIDRLMFKRNEPRCCTTEIT